jgi:transcription-repair coupling factor (superfamily II helicase)
VDFKNTGLLIIDEEHKFGIKQKNFIKDKQSNIHILYLSATPIPRTMNMVYAGLKDFSFIQTPPSNRINIKSFLKIQTNQLLKEALSREKSRNGQCFILQNDISKMDSLKKEINYLLPDYKIAIAHGKLTKKEIAQVMSDFQIGNLDGLICTTIVEMGLDIPNANTMIIVNAQNFGLAQLHQLRGRVGRSDKQGYCYFLVPTMEIPKISMSRLNSIIKHSKIGEGFLIAQEDLEIRGGGEMLGDKQSGHIENIGMSLYLSMLKSALKNTDETINGKEVEVNFYDSTYISAEYLPSPIERLKVYRQIDAVKTLDELKIIEKNLVDRCGKMPFEVTNLIENKKIELLILNSGITSIKSNNINTNFLIDLNVKDDLLNKLINLAKVKSSYYSLTKENKFIYKLNELKSEVRRQKIKSLLSDIL